MSSMVDRQLDTAFAMLRLDADTEQLHRPGVAAVPLPLNDCRYFTINRRAFSTSSTPSIGSKLRTNSSREYGVSRNATCNSSGLSRKTRNNVTTSLLMSL